MSESIGLGDVVSLGWGDGYSTATVSHVHKDGTVDVFRPYTHTADFSCAGREDSTAVICYVGIEEVRGLNPNTLRILRKGKELR